VAEDKRRKPAGHPSQPSDLGNCVRAKGLTSIFRVVGATVAMVVGIALWQAARDDLYGYAIDWFQSFPSVSSIVATNTSVAP
jgi:hypothetical protein